MNEKNKNFTDDSLEEHSANDSGLGEDSLDDSGLGEDSLDYSTDSDLDEDSVDDAANSKPKSKGPAVRIDGQYMEAINMSCPNSPGIFSKNFGVPDVSVSCDVNARKVADFSYSVVLSVSAKARVKGKDKEGNEKIIDAFSCDVKYSGLITLGQDVTDDDRGRILLVYAPTMLLPFARRIIATATTDSGFPPLMLDPIDFASKYEEGLKKEKAEN